MSLVIESLTLNSSGSMWVQWLFVGAVAFTGGGGCRAVACGRRVLLLRLRLGGHAAWDAAQSQGGKCRSTGLPLGPGGVRWDPAEVSHGEWIENGLKGSNLSPNWRVEKNLELRGLLWIF